MIGALRLKCNAVFRPQKILPDELHSKFLIPRHIYVFDAFKHSIASPELRVTVAQTRDDDLGCPTMYRNKANS